MECIFLQAFQLCDDMIHLCMWEVYNVPWIDYLSLYKVVNFNMNIVKHLQGEEIDCTQSFVTIMTDFGACW